MKKKQRKFALKSFVSLLLYSSQHARKIYSNILQHVQQQVTTKYCISIWKTITSWQCQTSATMNHSYGYKEFNTKYCSRSRRCQIFKYQKQYNILTTFTLWNLCYFAPTFTRCNSKETTVWISLSVRTTNWSIYCYTKTCTFSSFSQCSSIWVY